MAEEEARRLQAELSSSQQREVQLRSLCEVMEVSATAGVDGEGGEGGRAEAARLVLQEQLQLTRLELKDALEAVVRRNTCRPFFLFPFDDLPLSFQ